MCQRRRQGKPITSIHSTLQTSLNGKLTVCTTVTVRKSAHCEPYVRNNTKIPAVIVTIGVNRTVVRSVRRAAKLAAVKNLQLLLCPIVLLTATLPLTRELELEHSMALQCVTYI
jgi:hypothetical protein